MSSVKNKNQFLSNFYRIPGHRVKTNIHELSEKIQDGFLSQLRNNMLESRINVRVCMLTFSNISNHKTLVRNSFKDKFAI